MRDEAPILFAEEGINIRSTKSSDIYTNDQGLRHQGDNGSGPSSPRQLYLGTSIAPQSSVRMEVPLPMPREVKGKDQVILQTSGPQTSS